MARLKSLNISGIRSFPPNIKNVIEFKNPLTLIVGANGSGKTSIIECLKYATTGNFPPNAKGTVFVYDPSLNNETDGRAEIRLIFENSRGIELECVRGLQVSKRGDKMQHKTVESSLWRNGKCISTKVNDVDREIAEELGISNALMDDVIFCHQEEGGWPVGDGRIMKEKLEQIFSATKYVKAIKGLKDARKSLQNETRLKEQKFEYLNSEKRKREELMNKIKSICEDKKKYEEQVEKLCEEKEIVEKKLEKLKEEMRINEGIEKSMNVLKSEFEKHKSYIKGFSSRVILYDELLEVCKKCKISNNCKSIINDSSNISNDKVNKIVENNMSNKDMNIINDDRKSSTNRFEELLEILKEYYLSKLEGYDNYCRGLEYNGVNGRLSKIDEWRKEYALEVIRVDKIKGDLKHIEERCKEKYDEKNRCQKSIERNIKEITQKFKEIISSDIKNENCNNENLFNKNWNNELMNSIYDWYEEYINKKMEKNKNKIKIIEEHECEIRECEIQIIAIERTLGGDKKYIDSEEIIIDYKRLEELENISEKMSKRWQEGEEMLKKRYEEQDEILRREWLEKQIKAKRVEMEEINRKEYEIEVERLINKRDKEIFEMKGIEEMYNKQNEKIEKISQFIEESNNIYEEINKIRQKKILIYPDEESIINNKINIKKKIIEKLDNKTNDSNIFNSIKEIIERLIEGCKANYIIKEDKNKNIEYINEFNISIEILKKRLNNVDNGMAIYRNFQRIGEERSICPLCKTELSESCKIQFIERLRRVLFKMPQEKEELVKQIMIAEETKVINKATLDQKIVRIEKIIKLHEKLDIVINQVVDFINWKINNKNLKFDINKEKLEKLQFVNNNTNIELEKIKSKLEKVRFMDYEIKKLEIELSKIVVINYNINDIRKQVENDKIFANIAKQEFLQYELLIEEQERKQRRIDDFKQLIVLRKKYDILINQNLIIERDNIKNIIIKLNEFYELLMRNKIITKIELDRLIQLNEEEKILENEKCNLQKIITEFTCEKYNEFIIKEQIWLKNINNENKINNILNITETFDEIFNNVNIILQNIISQKMKIEKVKEKIALINENILLIKTRRRMIEIDEELKRYGHEKFLSVRTRIHELNIKLEKLQKNEYLTRGELKQIGIIYITSQEELIKNYNGFITRYANCAIELRAHELAIIDTDKCSALLDKAILEFHTSRMEEINIKLTRLWGDTYRGNDIDKIELRGTATSDKTHIYSLAMHRGNAILDMRGRCSAGQKMIAALLLRMALASVFASGCGILTLDEPTTNLDKENIESFASTLIELMRDRTDLQLIIISHDEEFVEQLTREGVDSYYRLIRDNHGNSHISYQSIYQS